MERKALISLIAAATIGSVVGQSNATNINWGNTNSDFNSGSSWVGGVVPGTGDNAYFPAAAAVVNPNITSLVSVAQIRFTAAGSSGYTISANPGQSLTLLGTTVISCAHTSGTNTISAPVVLGAAGGSTQTFSASGGTLEVSGPISSTNNVALSFSGSAGAITLSGANTFSGGLTTGVPTLNINYGGVNNTASAVGTGTLTLGDASHIGTIDNTSGSAVTLATNNSIAVPYGLVFVGSNSLNLGTGVVSSTTSKTITLNSTNGSILTLGGWANATSTGTVGLTANGTGKLVLGGINIGLSGSTGTTKLGGTAPMDINGSITGTAKEFSIQGGTKRLLASTSISATTMNVYSGSTLLIDNAISTTADVALSVASADATLGGTGSLTLDPGKILTVQGTALSGGLRAVVAPGDSGIGTLTVATSGSGYTTFTTYATLAVEVGALTADKLVVNGNLRLTSAANGARLDITPLAAMNASAYTLVDYSGSLTGKFAEVYYNGSAVDALAAETQLTGTNYKLYYNTADTSIQLIQVPEPAMISLLAMGTAGMMLRRRRR